MRALEVFAASSKFGDLVITEFNADRDVGRMQPRRFVEAIVKVMEGS
ncbi:hypothetical protein MJD09_24610 [bacterium]|nr:hypothetical protein [bacterium]